MTALPRYLPVAGPVRAGIDPVPQPCGKRTGQHVRSAVTSLIKLTPDSKASHRLDKPLSRSKETKSREVAMNDLAGCHYMEGLCRQRAVFDHAHSWKWLGEPERWKDLAHLEVGDRFREKPNHSVPITMGPNTIEDASRRQTHKSLQRLQSAMRGG